MAGTVMLGGKGHASRSYSWCSEVLSSAAADADAGAATKEAVHNLCFLSSSFCRIISVTFFSSPVVPH